ncbi:type VI secretion system-associated protein [Gammaproteobacteria bacterium 45_16_T64]|nr:type VI secretion system-associated protein [Gammaproteobacteria bacterium 45_16_T64]
MAFQDKVIWTEGMFLRPQHMQQHDRYIDSQFRERNRLLQRYGWGVKTLSVDENLLGQGTFSITKCSGVLADGTLFHVGSAFGYPLTLSLNESIQDQKVYLCLPVVLPGSDEAELDENPESLTRYLKKEVEVRDSNLGQGKLARLNTGGLRFKLLLEDNITSDYSRIAMTHIQEVAGDGAIVLDEAFIPPCIDISVAAPITQALSEAIGLLNHRAEALAGRLSKNSRTSTSEVADFLLLQLVNRYIACLQHWQHAENVHPELVFVDMVSMASEIATFTRKEKRLIDLPVYQHDDLRVSFSRLMGDIRQSLSMVFEQTAVALELQERNYGVKVAPIHDRRLLEDATFILAIKADWPKETVASRIPSAVKAGGVEQLRELVNLQLPGIRLVAMPMAPRQIPYNAGYTYFQMEKSAENWSHLRKSGGFAFHFSGEIPGLQLEFWAIKE